MSMIAVSENNNWALDGTTHSFNSSNRIGYFGLNSEMWIVAEGFACLIT
jgi:hypothetical protein